MAITTAAVGIDLGSYNARVATFDESLNQPVCAHNHDGNRATRVLHGDDNRAVTDTASLKTFLEEKLVPLASSAAHTKDLHIVASVPSGCESDDDKISKEWMEELRQRGGVITEAAAICLAYGLEESAQENQKFLVVDAGASGVKAPLMKYVQGGLWSTQWTKMQKDVTG